MDRVALFRVAPKNKDSDSDLAAQTQRNEHDKDGRALQARQGVGRMAQRWVGMLERRGREWRRDGGSQQQEGVRCCALPGCRLVLAASRVMLVVTPLR